MCDLCNAKTGECSSCQDCGCLICWDVKPGQEDDVMRRPYVTISGDLFCSQCGPPYDERGEAQEERDWDECWDAWDLTHTDEELEDL